MIWFLLMDEFVYSEMDIQVRKMWTRDGKGKLCVACMVVWYGKIGRMEECSPGIAQVAITIKFAMNGDKRYSR